MKRSQEELQFALAEYGDMIYRLALHYVRSGADAEDVVQETLLAYFTHAVPEERTKAWLLRVTVNKSIDMLRKRKRQSPLEGQISDDPPTISLADELARLPALDREIVYLFYYEGYTSREIAGLVGRSDAAVRKRLERAKVQLKRFLEEEE